MNAPGDPWPAFLEKYLYSLMRNLVSYHGTMSAKHYVRIEGLLRRLVAGRERQLKRAVLQDVLARWANTRAPGAKLEDAFREALAEVSEGNTTDFDLLVREKTGVGQRRFFVHSSDTSSYEENMRAEPEPESPPTHVPHSGVRELTGKRRVG